MKKFHLLTLLLPILFFISSCRPDKGNLEENESSLISQISEDNSRMICFSDKLSSENPSSRKEAVRNPKRPSLPSDVIDMISSAYEDWKAQENTNYTLAAGQVWDKGIQLKKNTNYYIFGTLKLNCYGSGGTVYIMPGGRIELSSVLSSGLTIENFGELSCNGNDLTINSGVSLQSYGYEVFETGKLSIHGAVSLNEDVKAKSIEIDGNAEVSFKGEVHSQDVLRIFNASKVSFEKCAYAETLITGSSSYIYFDKGIICKGNANLSNNTNVYIRDYFSAANVELNSQAKIFLGDNALLSSEGVLEFANPTAKIYNTGDDYAVVECSKIIIHQDAIERLSGGPIDLHTKEIDNRTGSELRWTANVVFDQKTYIPAKDCRPEFGEPNKSEKEYVLEHLAQVLSPDDKKISATAIDFKQQDAYVSWHEYGDPYQGYIDIVNINNLKIKASYYSSLLDFNHIYVNNNLIYVAGGRASGAFYGGVSVTGSNVDIELIKVAGASGNCVLRENEKTWVVSGAQGGLSIFPANEYKVLAEAKYVIKQDNSIAVLAGTDDTKIHLYSPEGEVKNSFSIGTISPKNGKNTLAADGENIYVAMGYSGVKCIRNGAIIASFANTDTELNAAANCVDVDDTFVYVANGNAGLYILDKTDLSLVKRYTLGGASANFVKKGEDGLIYVAYGLKGVHAFRLNLINKQ